jgi:LmbE family N-acetylglucosaminyl deacetylase
MTKRIAGALLLLFFISLKSFAQSNIPSAEIYLKVKKLNVLGSVLYIAAHPDDENTRLLAYFSKDRLYRTGYLSLTRGDGGQNLIGDEQGIELGLIRTQELLSARRIDGAEQFFSRAFDFGFSKTPVETFTKWDKEKILSDVVWVIRKFQPDVIITRFPTTGEGGHGHHTASAILANEAFTAAADPKRFPEQLKYVQPWQAKRILWNTFNFGGNNTTREDQFHFDVGGYNSILGKSYGEIAADGRSQHKSQGFGVARTRGEAIEYFSTTGGSNLRNDIFEDVTTGWSRVPGSEKISSQINNILAQFNFTTPERSLPSVVELYKEISALAPGYWRDQKLKEVKDLLEDMSGLWMEVYTTQPSTVPGDSVKLNISVNNRLGANIYLQKIKFDGFDSSFGKPLVKNQNNNWTKTFFLPASTPVTQPYWLREPMKEGYYQVSDQQLIGQPDVQPAFTAKFSFVIEGLPVEFEKPVRYKMVDPVRGELYEPFVVLPMINFSEFTPVHLASEKKDPVITITSQKDISIPSPATVSQVFDKRTDTVPYLFGGFTLKKGVPHNELFTTNDPKVYKLNVVPDYRDAGTVLRTIKYEHIPDIYYTRPAILTVKNIDLQIRGKRIGYIVGAGDKVPQALEGMGYDVVMLGQKELARMDLKTFDAIITGVRAYNTNEWLNSDYDKLMKYVEDGGNLIVQYNTSNNIGPVRAKISPYNFNISRNRITDENAAVTFLKPDHVLLNFPNKITQEDFKGWIQERSIYHATDLDKNFETIFRMNDPGEAPDDGSLITAKYGKGFFTYTGIVFFRELPAGVTGAYRLLANIIALNQKKEL